MLREWDGIYFLCNWGEFAFRAWDRVPRVGEIVVLGAADAPYKVIKVLWCETRSAPIRQYAKVEIQPA